MTEFLGGDLGIRFQIFGLAVISGLVFYYLILQRLRIRQNAVQAELKQGMDKLDKLIEQLKMDIETLPGRSQRSLPGSGARIQPLSANGHRGTAPKSSAYRAGLTEDSAAVWDSYGSITELFRKGVSISEISERTGIPRGEVQLVLDLGLDSGVSLRRRSAEIRLS
ncbi:hypothetical protein TRIP_B200636 [uncultured Desulfatiglans sp.]|uniref:DUF2802 domain-containing protein n=1 Tax=Uncultured Desulfatiglans sp. TaxID=1748965 RepID=A0A653A380_UNCDX|nr:hypothetical protein TRIP_B200636 [uncultured Desulfatiglans sp.]